MKTCSCASWAYFSLRALTCSVVGGTRGEVSGVEAMWSFSRVEVTAEVILSIVEKVKGARREYLSRLMKERRLRIVLRFVTCLFEGSAFVTTLFPYFYTNFRLRMSLFCCEFGQSQATMKV